MKTNIIKNKTIKEYNKKYRHNTSLLKLTKKDLETFDKQHNCVGENRLLKNKTWWLIDNTYYEVPKPLRKYWFRNLNKGIQITACALLGLGIAGGATAGYLYGYYNKSAVVDKTSSDKLDIISVKTNEKGDQLIEAKGKEGTTDLNIEVYKGKDKLVEKEEYIVKETNSEFTSYFVMVYKAALDKHFGPVKLVVTNYKKQIVVKPSSVKLNIGDRIHLDAYFDGQKIEAFFMQAGVCLEDLGDGDFEAQVVGKSTLYAMNYQYGEPAVVPVTVTTDKNVIVTPERTGNIKVGEDLTISAKLDTGEAVDFEFATESTNIEIIDKTSTTAKIHAKKSGYGIVMVKTGKYYTLFQINVNEINVIGEHNIAIPTGTDPVTYDFTTDASAEGGEITWSIDPNYPVTAEEASINPTTGVLTVNPAINRLISTFVIAKKEDEVSKFNIIISSCDKLDFEVDRQRYYSFVKSKEGATGDIIYLPTSYYDNQLKEFVKVVGLSSEAFKDNTSIKSIKLTDNIQTIGTKAFNGCTALDGDLELPNNVNAIGKEFITGCTALDGVKFDDVASSWIMIDENESFTGFTPSSTPSENKTTIDSNHDKDFIKSNLLISGNLDIKVNDVSQLSTSLQNVEWSIQNSGIATIDETGKLTGKSVGSTYVFAFDRTNGRIGTKVVTVSEA